MSSRRPPSDPAGPAGRSPRPRGPDGRLAAAARYGATRRRRSALSRARGGRRPLIVAVGAGRARVRAGVGPPEPDPDGRGLSAVAAGGRGAPADGTGAALLAAAERQPRGRPRITWCSSSPPATRARGASMRGTATATWATSPGLARPGLDEALYWKTLRPHGSACPSEPFRTGRRAGGRGPAPPRPPD